MITISDSIVLATAKLRSRKMRTFATVFLASLLFGVLVATSLVVNGAYKSIDSFRNDGLTGRYIVSVYPAINDPLLLSSTLRDPVLVGEAKERYAALVRQKIAEAERLGVSYTQASDQPPYSIASDGEERLTLNDQNGIVSELLEEKYSHEPSFDDAELTATAKKYGATNFFSMSHFNIERNASLEVLPDGKEVFYDELDDVAFNENYKTPIVDGMQMTLAPTEINRPFLLPENGGWQPIDGSLPVVLPQNRIEQLLGLEPLSANASSREKSDRLKVVRTRAVNLSFQACYRNSSSKSLIQQTIQGQKEFEANKTAKDFQYPLQIYELPDPEACSEPTVLSDTRTMNQKTQDENKALFDSTFGQKEVPSSYFVSFKVVGISPTESSQTSQENAQSAVKVRNFGDVLDSLLATNGIQQIIPSQLYDKIPDKDKYKDLFTYTPTYLFGNEDNKQRFVEFTNSNNAQRFINEQSCATQSDGTCKPTGRLYQASLAFSNSVALDDIRIKTSHWFNYAMLIVIVLATIIMYIAIGRTIVDGRHETAVFRAIGFSRIDIAQVYLLYASLLSLLVAVCATGLGFAGAFFIDYKYAPDLTARAQYAFSDLSMSKTATLIEMNSQQLILLAAACLSVGILSIIFPLLRNVYRSPMRDMREE